MITHAIVQSGARKKPWRVGSSQPGNYRTHSCSRFPFLSFSLCCVSFFEERSVRNGCCWAWLQRSRSPSCHQDVAWCWCWEYARVEWVFTVCKATINRVRNRLQAGGTIERTVGSGSIQHQAGVATDACNARYSPGDPANGGSASTAKICDHIEDSDTGEVVSRRTVCRALHRKGLAAKRRRPGPALMEHHNEAREVWCVTPPMKQRKDWNEKKMVKAITIKTAQSWQHVVQVHLTSNARAMHNFFKVGEVTSVGGSVASPIWPHGALRRSFWWSLINDVSNWIPLFQAVCVCVCVCVCHNENKVASTTSDTSDPF